MIKILDEDNLFKDVSANITLPAGEKLGFARLMMVDEIAMLNLEDEKILNLFRKGYLAWVYAHLYSLSNFRPLMGLASKGVAEKQEEKEDEQAEGFFDVWKAHSDAIYAFMWLFLGFILAFSFWYIILGDSNLLNAQIETYCKINNPGNVEDCVAEYDFAQKITSTGAATKEIRFLSIIENNVYVMIFTLIFSLIFGAGAIFILAWNASVIAAAIGIFTKYQIIDIPFGVARYMIHGFPEIASYFITALAGGMFGVGAIKNGIKSPKFLKVVENVVILLFMAIFILIIAAAIEVYFTPILFR